ncbi:hypothetical protein M501DRAFT_1001175 [Patellaria atrata CBS 101060]|uniref:Uncharacterized protein n=1 Tax=Patellaria atrata CBS 101060 TaxID=1346257 RepID=A0A9P4S342_9PEZI|nr:hypothetical protein M501DRAFT_1001175 [Patellaria atrata CBS 101060]
MLSSEDPHTGGDLSSMAAKRTNIPNDAGVHNTIPSVARPDQSSAIAVGGIGQASLALAADNPTDIPRSYRDTGLPGEVITGTGDQLPASVEGKQLGGQGHDNASKGDPRYGKHHKQKGSDFERLVTGEGPNLEDGGDDRKR